VVVVEGYMDAISIYQAGLKSVVATMGTAFTEEQIKTLWRLSSEPIVCFDADAAGIGAAYRSVDRILPLLQVGKTFRFVFMQGGKDPDELIRQKGLEAFKDVLLGSLPLWDVLWERETSGSKHKFDTPDSRAALEQRLYSIIRTIQDKVVYTAYFRTCRLELFDFLWRVKGPREQAKEGFRKTELKIEKEGYRHGLQKVLLGMLVQYPEFMDDKVERIASVKLDDDLEQFRRAVYDLLLAYPEMDVEVIYTQLGYKVAHYYRVLQDIHGDRDGKLQRGHRLFSRFPILAHDPPHEFVGRCIDHFLHALEIEEMVGELTRLRSELDRDGPEFDAASTRLLDLVREIHRHREKFNGTDVLLDEEASEIKRVGRGVERPMAAVGKPAPVPA